MVVTLNGQLGQHVPKHVREFNTEPDHVPIQYLIAMGKCAKEKTIKLKTVIRMENVS